MNKSNKLVASFSALSSFSAAAFSLHQKSGSNMHDLVSAHNPLLQTDHVSLASSNAHRKSNYQALLSSNLQSPIDKHFKVSTLIPRAPSNFKSLLGTLVFSIFFVPVANAGTYYVATNGSDTNPGTLSAPWRTITKAANTLIAGDAVNIRAGTYKERVAPKNSGNASNGFIAYGAYPGETVTIDASGSLRNGDWRGAFDISNRSYIQVSGIRFVNSPGFGVYIAHSTNIRILNNYTYSTYYSGIYTEYCDTITIDGNEVVQANTGASQESISIYSTNNFTVSHNSVHDGNMEGIDAKVSPSNGKIFGNKIYNMLRVGIYVDAWETTADNIEIYDNTVSDSKYAEDDGIMIGGELGGTASNITVYNNILNNVGKPGVVTSYWTESGNSKPKFSNISIYNNSTDNNVK
ncbi:right-handed parallel beta-helix repeat-containing protein [Methylobacter sp.]|uniref:right-handed parallel beta-helix repeat-containing protein n=1 Tax=Methylobacter sp. TaxID=2051955 RepID=UPI002FDE0F5E